MIEPQSLSFKERIAICDVVMSIAKQGGVTINLPNNAPTGRSFVILNRGNGMLRINKHGKSEYQYWNEEAYEYQTRETLNEWNEFKAYDKELNKFLNEGG
jgi:hypothetical protein